MAFWLNEVDPRDKRVLVFAAGGGADIVFVRFLAGLLWRGGAAEVDVAQPLNRSTIETEAAQRFQIESLAQCANQVGAFTSVTPNVHQEAALRGKGIALAAAIEWRHGLRLVFAATGTGCQSLARREWRPHQPYDMAIAVDGGGDVLTGGASNFDRVVLDRFRAAWDGTRLLSLVVIGLGADGASEHGAFAERTLNGWECRWKAHIDAASSEEIDSALRLANRLHPDPLAWTSLDRYWSRGLHVPQIVTLAARSQLPMSQAGFPYVLAPRRSEASKVPTETWARMNEAWMVLNGDLAKTACCFRASGPSTTRSGSRAPS